MSLSHGKLLFLYHEIDIDIKVLEAFHFTIQMKS